MGAASAKAWLWRPGEGQELRLPGACEEHLLGETFEEELKRFFGSVTFATSSWKHLAALAESREEHVVSLLQQSLDPESQEPFDVRGARILALHGAMNPHNDTDLEGNPTGSSWLSWLPNLEPRISLYLDSDGSVRSSTAVNAQHFHFQPPPMPSLEALGLAEKLRELRASSEEEEAAGCSSYGLRLSQTYTVTKWCPPMGPIEWSSELVVLHLRLAPRTTFVLQISTGVAADDGKTEVLARSIAGDEVLSLRCDLAHDSVEVLVLALAEHCKCSRQRLCLVSPRGSMLKGSSVEIATLLGPWLLPDGV